MLEIIRYVFLGHRCPSATPTGNQNMLERTRCVFLGHGCMSATLTGNQHMLERTRCVFLGHGCLYICMLDSAMPYEPVWPWPWIVGCQISRSTHLWADKCSYKVSWHKHFNFWVTRSTILLEMDKKFNIRWQISPFPQWRWYKTMALFTCFNNWYWFCLGWVRFLGKVSCSLSFTILLLNFSILLLLSKWQGLGLNLRSPVQ